MSKKNSSDVALGDGVVQILPKSAAKEFVRAPILWPIMYTCNLVVSIIYAVIKVTTLLQLTHDTEKRPKRPRVCFNPFTIFIEGWTTSRVCIRQHVTIQTRTASHTLVPATPNRQEKGRRWIGQCSSTSLIRNRPHP